MTIGEWFYLGHVSEAGSDNVQTRCSRCENRAVYLFWNIYSNTGLCSRCGDQFDMLKVGPIWCDNYNSLYTQVEFKDFLKEVVDGTQPTQPNM